jgi:hypothetical protein
LAKCGNVVGVTAYSWQEHVECDSSGGGFGGSSSSIQCPLANCQGPPKVNQQCSVSDMDDICTDSRSGKDYIIACKPTIMSQVQFAQPSFPVTQVPAITGAVSFEDVANSKATQFAIVLIASLGIFIITLLNIVHKEN